MSSTASPTLPTPEQIARLLRDLFGKQVTPKKCPPMPSSIKRCTGTYIDDTGKLAAVSLCDLPLAAAMGSALALMPPGTANEAARSGVLSPEMFENLREVLNIMASLFGGVHVRLKDALAPPLALPKDLTAVVDRHAARMDLELGIAGYSGGRLALLIA